MGSFDFSIVGGGGGFRRHRFVWAAPYPALTLGLWWGEPAKWDLAMLEGGRDRVKSDSAEQSHSQDRALWHGGLEVSVTL